MRIEKKKTGKTEKAGKRASAALAAVCLLFSLNGSFYSGYNGYVRTVQAASQEEISQEEVLIVEPEVVEPKQQPAPEGEGNAQGGTGMAGNGANHTEGMQDGVELSIEAVEYGVSGSKMVNGTESGNGETFTANGTEYDSAMKADNEASGESVSDTDEGIQGESETNTGDMEEGESEPDTDDGTQLESGSEASGESETEQSSENVIESESKPDGEKQSESETEPDSGTQEKAVYLGIDNRHRYAGMKQSFSEGYQPKVKKDTLYLAVPFTASGALKGDCLTVDLAFSQEENSPFVFKNYQKDVARKWYVLQDGIMTEATDQSGQSAHVSGSGEQEFSDMGAGTGNVQDPSRQQAYLYTCEIPLQPGAAPGQYSVTVKAWGYTPQGEKLALDYQVFVRIPEPKKSGKESIPDAGGSGISSGGGGGGFSDGGGGTETEEIVRQPKMLLEDCSLTGKSLEAGKKERMKVSFRNCSEAQTMYNLKIVLQTESKAVRPARNSFYFSEVAPGETIELENELSVTPLAEEESAALTFQFEYEDKKGTAASGTETVTIPIVQPVQVEMETGLIPVSVYAADTVELTLTALNLSRTGVYNVRAKLEGTGLFPVEDVFIGNMEAGSQGSGTMRVYVGTRTMEAIGDDPGTQDSEKYGPVNGTITLQYEDALGETHEVKKDYQTEIKKAEVLSLKVDQEPEQNSWWISVFAALIAGLLLLVVILIWRLRKKGVLLEEARKHPVQ